MSEKEIDPINEEELTTSRMVFENADPEIQELARRILQVESKLMHLKNRQGHDVYVKLLQEIKERIR